MQTQLSPEFEGTRDGEEAQAIVRKCVHCGFCNATCPTYQLLGDELDGPRGRIYLIKQVLEGAEVTRSTQQHLDRCLTCLNCQTTCPSGVEYGHLVDIGRKIVDERVARPAAEQAVRWLLREGLTSPLFAPAMRVGQAVRPLLPGVLKDKVPAADDDAARNPPPAPLHQRKVLMLRGCVQPSMMPSIDEAAARVLDRADIGILYAGGSGCCGAVRAHLSDPDGEPRGHAPQHRCLDAARVRGRGAGHRHVRFGLQPRDQGVRARTGRRLSVWRQGGADQRPRARLKRTAAGNRARPAGQNIAPRVRSGWRFMRPARLQHGQKLKGVIETSLRSLGFDVDVASGESHLCCGSAGTYSILQPDLARELRDRKLKALRQLEPQYIISANVGCIQHLKSGTLIPVKHWIEVLDEALLPESPEPAASGAP